MFKCKQCRMPMPRASDGYCGFVCWEKGNPPSGIGMRPISSVKIGSTVIFPGDVITYDGEVVVVVRTVEKGEAARVAEQQLKTVRDDRNRMIDEVLILRTALEDIIQLNDDTLEPSGHKRAEGMVKIACDALRKGVE